MSEPRADEAWLAARTPREWIAEALAELSRAERAYSQNDARGGLACAKRAAGMAINAALCIAPREGFGRSYVDHVIALGHDVGAPDAVRAACRVLLETHAPGSEVISLRSVRRDRVVLDAARDVMAHAYAIVVKHE